MVSENSKQSSIDKLVHSRLIYRRRRIYSMVGLLILLLIIISIAASLGTARVPLPTVWRLLFSWLPWFDTDTNLSYDAPTIILDVRMPRILLAGLAGASLATAGAIYQGLFRNPLADPYIIGVAQGAGLGAVVAFIIPFSIGSMLGIVPLFAFCGGLLSAGMVYALARVGKTLPMSTVVLAGVAMGAFSHALTSFLMLNSGEDLHSIFAWLMGSFSKSEWIHVQILTPYLLACLSIIYLYSRPLNLMQLDEEQAQQLGVNVERVKLVLLLTATLITAIAVSFAGTIGFVGIIIPHTVRLIWGPDYRFLLPMSTIAGAIFLILADLLARMLLSPQEIPVGSVTAFFGAPFFLFLLWQKKRSVVWW